MNIKRKLLAGAVGGSALLGSALALAPSAFASATTSTTTATGQVNNSGYMGTLTDSTTTNSQWKIDNYTLFVTGQYGWTNTFKLQVQTPVSGNHSAPVVTGSVTDTTEYGTSIEGFTVPSSLLGSTPVVPFSLDPTSGHILVDNGNWYGIYNANPGTSFPAPFSLGSQSSDPAGWYMLNTQSHMVYGDGGQNAGYWFGS